MRLLGFNLSHGDSFAFPEGSYFCVYIRSRQSWSLACWEDACCNEKSLPFREEWSAVRFSEHFGILKQLSRNTGLGRPELGKKNSDEMFSQPLYLDCCGDCSYCANKAVIVQSFVSSSVFCFIESLNSPLTENFKQGGFRIICCDYSPVIFCFVFH